MVMAIQWAVQCWAQENQGSNMIFSAIKVPIFLQYFPKGETERKG